MKAHWLVLWVLAACDSPVVPTPPPPPPPAPAPATTIAASGPSHLTGNTGAFLPQPLGVRVTKSKGEGLPGIAVTWGVSSGAGWLGPGPFVTDVNGYSWINFRPDTPGSIEILASAPGLDGSPVHFLVDTVGEPTVVISFSPLFDC